MKGRQRTEFEDKKEPSASFDTVLVEAELKIRQSTAPPPAE
jgi:hypothetical protein